MHTLEQLGGLRIFRDPHNLVVKFDQVCAEKGQKVEVNDTRFQTEMSGSTVWPPRTTPVVGLTPDTGERLLPTVTALEENNVFVNSELDGQTHADSTAMTTPHPQP